MNDRGTRNPSASPAFDPARFRRGLMTIFIPMIVAVVLLSFAPQGMMLARMGSLFSPGSADRARAAEGSVMIGSIASGGLAVGLIALGGLAIGLIAAGGAAIGVIAIGGGAVGVIALGGGAVGLFAFGGGAAGLVAIGGGAVGRYVLAGDGFGRHVLSYKRQDRTAAEFFCHWFPPLRQAFPLGIEALDSAQSTHRRRTG